MRTFVKIMKKEGKTIGFVPTMGYLHEGHVSLMRSARAHTDVVVISIFVNPIQFGAGEDYEKYPRDHARDEDIAGKAGVDVIFRPKAEEMYPDGYSTFVTVDGLTEGLCGASRPGHFRGVSTVVAKLFSIVRPDIAYFGQKDAQQSVVVKKMAADLDMDIDVKVLPTVRERGGLAMSSRNAYLSEAEREDAGILYASLKKAEAMIAGGIKDPLKVKETMKEMIMARPSARIDYISIVDAKNLKEVTAVEGGDILIALAVFIGRTRLIDNVIVKA